MPDSCRDCARAEAAEIRLFETEAVVPALSPGFDELTLDVPGSFRFNDLPDGAGYTVRAFLDADGDGSPGSSEPSGVTTTDVAGDTTSDVILQGRPSITSQPQGVGVFTFSFFHRVRIQI